MMIHEYLEAVPSRIAGLANLLLAAGSRGLRQKEAVSLLQPPTLRKTDAPPSVIAPRTMDAALAIGLVVHPKGDDEFIALNEAAFERLRRAEDFFDELREILSSVLLAEKIQGQPNEFAQIVAWFLAQPANWMPSGHFDVQESMESQGIDLPSFRMNNTSCLDNVIYWARFMGLLWKAEEEGACAIIPDPTDYIKAHLTHLIEPGQRMPIAEFIEAIGRKCPVLDGGAVRAKLLALTAERNATPWQEDRLSAALSLAIRQLNNAGVLFYGCPNDARSFHRMAADERISFIELPGVKSGGRSARRVAAVKR